MNTDGYTRCPVGNGWDIIKKKTGNLCILSHPDEGYFISPRRGEWFVSRADSGCIHRIDAPAWFDDLCRGSG